MILYYILASLCNVYDVIRIATARVHRSRGRASWNGLILFIFTILSWHDFIYFFSLRYVCLCKYDNPSGIINVARGLLCVALNALHAGHTALHEDFHGKYVYNVHTMNIQKYHI